RCRVFVLQGLSLIHLKTILNNGLKILKKKIDSESEELIQAALANLMKGKTVIVIAHRLSTIMKMDRIVVMRDGEILEEGSHQTLLKNKDGLYQKLWNKQAGGFIE
ncbi:MAG: hypothetical protein NTV81_02845, partial [Candidatus Komeilibacteria bacterium]|nr:hypothetical protein [Candidatus Komeilibacteria bacterium]